VLVVVGGNIVFTRRMTPSEDCINVVEARLLPFGINRVNLKFHLASIRQTDRLDRAEDTVFVDRVNAAHGENSVRVILF
jgi:hypothetical protein